MCYPADPPTVDEIVAVMRHAGDDRHGWRVRAMIVVLWRAGLIAPHVGQVLVVHPGDTGIPRIRPWKRPRKRLSMERCAPTEAGEHGTL